MSRVQMVWRFVCEWMLLVAMLLGAGVYGLFHFIPGLSSLKSVATELSSWAIPVLLFLTLFFTFCKVDVRHMRPQRWHVTLLLIQLIGSLGVVGVQLLVPALHGNSLCEAFLVCLMCPTAAAAAVVASKLGGDETALTTYTILSNLMAAFTIPLIFPLLNATIQGSFFSQCAAILLKVFPMLILPLLCATVLRLWWPRGHQIVLKRCRGVSFHLWAINLAILIGVSMRSMMNSPFSWAEKGALALVGLVACAVFFPIGKMVGAHWNARICGGQAFGQKNTVFAIWVTLTYLSPVLSLAPASYIVWQNFFNSWQIERYLKRQRKA